MREIRYKEKGKGREGVVEKEKKIYRDRASWEEREGAGERDREREREERRGEYLFIIYHPTVFYLIYLFKLYQ